LLDREQIERGPERLVTEGEIHFEDGPLAGMRLVGFFLLWRSTAGELYVTFSRARSAPAFLDRLSPP